MIGHNDGNQLVVFKSSEGVKPGDFVEVLITDYSAQTLIGDLI